MPAISRQVGTVSTTINVFVPDATVSTGVGLANIVASTVRLAWYRSDSTGVSSYTLTSGTLGSFAGSTMTQASSSVALGWYQVSLPDSLFASGHHAVVHLAGAASMAPVPIIIELTKTDQQAYLSTQVIGRVQNGVNVSSIHGSAFVTTAAGVVSAGVSTVTGAVGSVTGATGSVTGAVGSVTAPVGVSTVTIPVGVSSFYSSAAVTTAAGVLSAGVSTVTGAVGSVTGAVGSVTGAVGSVTAPVGVSTVTTPVGVTTGSIGVSSATATVREAIADSFLNRNVSTGANTGRLVKEALYVLRNKVDAGLGIVYETDDTTSSWAFTVSTQPSDPIVSITPN